MSREYKLRSPGNPGGLVPLTGSPAPAPAPEAAPAPAPAPTVARFAAGMPALVAPIIPAAPPAAAAAPAARAPRQPGGNLLSDPQKAAIGSAANRAFLAMVTQDPDWLPDMLQQGHTKTALTKNWRHSQCAIASKGHPAGQIAGLSKARNAHYNTLLAHFLALAGEDTASFRATMRDGDVSGPAGGTQDDFRQGKWKIEEAMKKTGLGWGYVMAIVKRKHHTQRLEDLTGEQLRQIAWTVGNRDKDHKWKAGEKALPPEYRNKSQRQKKATSAALPDNCIQGDFLTSR